MMQEEIFSQTALENLAKMQQTIIAKAPATAFCTWCSQSE
jgi:hypothetical protein